MHVANRKPHEKGLGKASWGDVSGGKMERTGFPEEQKAERQNSQTYSRNHRKLSLAYEKGESRWGPGI